MAKCCPRNQVFSTVAYLLGPQSVCSMAYSLLQLVCMTSALWNATVCPVPSPFGAARCKTRVIDAESKSAKRLAPTIPMTLAPRWFVTHDRNANGDTVTGGVFRNAFSSHPGLAREEPDKSFRSMTKRVLVLGRYSPRLPWLRIGSHCDQLCLSVVVTTRCPLL
ncbi:hypothetical protein EDB85DRAFT_1923132 [Lactarius pseudohatsudake]|nr:hypothetical protein EDB85DRAFT_1923132 [Lactarius pseudohatsudake]